MNEAAGAAPPTPVGGGLELAASGRGRDKHNTTILYYTIISFVIVTVTMTITITLL